MSVEIVVDLCPVILLDFSKATVLGYEIITGMHGQCTCIASVCIELCIHMYSFACLIRYVFYGLNFIPVALRKVKIVYSFGLSECNRVKRNRKEFVFCIYMCLIQPEFDV